MLEASTPFSLTVSAGSLESYIFSLKKIPLLTPEQEARFARSWHEKQDINAAKQLVMAHLRYVVSIAKRYSGYGLPLADLIQEGNIGLMKAVKRFDPNVGVKLISFAAHWIKAEIHEFVLRNWRIVKIATTKAQRRLFFKLKSFKQKFGSNMTVIAQEMGIKKNTVEQMNARLSHSDGDIDEIHTLADPHADPAKLIENQDQHQHTENLLEALQNLDARSRDILYQRFLSEKKCTLQELSQHYNVSFQRICQIEKSAMDKLKKILKN